MQCRLFLAGFLLQTGLFHMVILLVLLICRTKQHLGPVNRLSVYDTLQGGTGILPGILRLSYSFCLCHPGLNSSCSGCRAPSLFKPLHGSYYIPALLLTDIQAGTILGKGHMANK